MVTCPTCGGGNFEEIAGLFYCSECNTQSQELRVEEVDDYTELTTFGHNSGRVPAKRSRSKSAQQHEDVYTHEILNEVLLAQLGALERLGASPRLRRVVRTLWLTFLRRCQLAFLSQDPGEEKTPRLGVVNYQRDVLLTAQRRPQDNVRRALLASGIRTRVIQHKGRRCRISRFQGDEDNVDSDVTQLDASDDPQLYSEVAEAFLSWKQYKERLTSTKPSAPMRDSFLHLRKLLAFLYLGVLIAREPVLLADLVRWSAQGHLPYLRAWNQQAVNFSYRTVPPRAPQVLVETARLARFLGAPTHLKSRPLQPLVARFLLDLNLPLELLKLSNWLQMTNPFLVPQHWTPRAPLRSVAFPAEELSAAALLLILLKLTLGLDGSSEQRLSLSADSVNGVSGTRIFSWFCWEQQERAREAVLVDHCCFSTLGDPTHVACLPKMPVHWDPESTQAAMRKELQSCFRGLYTRASEVATIPPSSFPFSTQICTNEGRRQRKDFTDHHVLCFLGVPLEDVSSLEKSPDDYWMLHDNTRLYALLIEPLLPGSFAWVLQLMASLVGSRPSHLYHEVIRLEKLLFLGKKAGSRFKRGLHRDADYDHILHQPRQAHGAESGGGVQVPTEDGN